ncbi:MAG: glycosyltransferase family 2 protein [Crocinitomicaceae bacterium]|nr:glycosyltransferase family 2 protein [Crocinitomicaceae bacterium]
MKSRVSILMPNYNNGPYLEDCLNSIFSQSLQEFSLIIIDDFSSDNSVEIIKKWNDPRIVLIERKINGGIVAALNDGLDVVQTEYIISQLQFLELQFLVS